MEKSITPSRLEGENALFDGELNGIVALCFENERPLQGLSGLLDWRFQGILSHYIRRGLITGRPGECVYVPVQKKDRTYHLILVGAGNSKEPGRREQVGSEVLEPLKKNLKNLKLDRLGVSCQDFGDVDPEYFEEKLEGTQIRTIQ